MNMELQTLSNYDTLNLSSRGGHTSDSVNDTTINIADSEEYYPDGGIQGYLVVVGSFFGFFTSLGLVNAIGAIQSFVSNNQLSDLKPIDVSWIFSVYLSIYYAIGLVAGSIFDYYGAKMLLITATGLTFSGLMGSASSTKVYQFVLSFLALGIGNGISVTPLVGSINHWFLRKRGFMTGLATSAGSVGGLTFPLLLNFTFANYGFVWGLRILAIVCTVCLFISIFLVKERFLRKRQSIKPFEIKTIISILQKHNDKKFIYLTIGSLCAELALVLILTYFVTFTVAQGFSESQGFLLLTVWNSSGILGRVLPGLASDYLGKLNVHFLMLSCFTLCIFTIWYAFGYNLAALYVFSILGGFSQGLVSGLTPACLALITKVSEFGERFGILNFCLSIGNLLGIPIGASIIDDGSVTHYKHFIILCGTLMLMGTLFIYITRFSMVGITLNIKV